MAKLSDVIRRGTRGAQPAATAVAVGTLYYVTDESVTERSTGAAWESFSDAGSAGAPTDATYATFSANGTLSAEVNIAAKQLVMYGADGDFSAERVVTTPATGGNIPKVIRKTANETVNNSAVLQNDDHLLYSMAANEEVFFKLAIRYTSNTTPDLKMAFTAPAGVVALNWWHASRNTALATVVDFKTGSGTTDSFGGADATVLGLILEGICMNGANAGDLQLQWAQNTQNSSDTIIYENSCMLVWQLATS